MNFLRSLGNWASFLVLAGGAVVVTYIAGNNLGSFVNLNDFSVTLLQALIEAILFVTTIIFTGFALKKAWQELGTKKNGFSFGIVFSALIATIIAIRVTMIIPNTAVFPIVVFSMLFLSLMYAGYKVVPAKHQILLIFFGRILVGDEIRDGMAWILPFANIKIYDLTNQTISLSKTEEMPAFPDGTTLEKLDLQFMYHLLPGSLHVIFNFGDNWQREIKIVLEDSLRSSTLAVAYLTTQEELAKYHFNAYAIFVASSVKVLKTIMSYGIIFPNPKDFPELLEDAFYRSRALKTFERLYLEKEGFKKIITNSDGDRESIFINSLGQNPSEDLLKKIKMIPEHERIMEIVDNNVEVFVISHLQRDAISRNKKSLDNMPHRGLFQKAKALAFNPLSLNIRLIDPSSKLKEKIEQFREEDTERKAEQKHIDAHAHFVKTLVDVGLDPHVASIVSGSAQKMTDLPKLVMHHYKGDGTKLSGILAGLDALINKKTQE